MNNTLRKFVLILLIGLVGILLFARNRHIIPFNRSKVNLSAQEIANKHLLLEDFHSIERIFPNTILLGGGKSILVLDTISNQIVTYDQFVDNKSDFRIQKDQLSNFRDDKISDTKDIALFDFSDDQRLYSFLKINVSRNFYLGIYRELIECLETWQKKYTTLLISTKLILNENGSRQVLLGIKTFSNNKEAEVAFLIPLTKSDQHLYEYLVKSNDGNHPEINSFLSKIGYAYPDYSQIKKIWRVDAKRFELRNLKWNFD